MSEEVLTVVHTRLKNVQTATPYGTVTLDHRGVVTNLEDLSCSAERLISVPEFEDADIFGIPDIPEPVTKGSEDPTPEESDEDEPTDENLYAFMLELIEGGAATTSDGMIQMEDFNAALRERGWPTMSGGQRKEIWDAFHSGSDED